MKMNFRLFFDWSFNSSLIEVNFLSFYHDWDYDIGWIVIFGIGLQWEKIIN